MSVRAEALDDDRKPVLDRDSERLQELHKTHAHPRQTKAQLREGSVGHAVPPPALELLAIVSSWERERLFALRNELTSLQGTSTHPRIFGQH